MELTLFQVDAFSTDIFGGNPAAVVPLEQWLPVETMQNIAAENNLSETAFFVKEKEAFHIRWFTPTVEIPLCGHATLASAHVIFNHLNFSEPEITFECEVGTLKVRNSETGITMNFPMQSMEPIEAEQALFNALGKAPKEMYNVKENYVLVYDKEADVANMQPDFSALKKCQPRSINVTAAGNEVDFVSRFFCPKDGIDEDPVTGSAHTRLIPYWSEKLNKKKLSATQLSARKGQLDCEHLGDRVEMSGHAKTYLIGKIYL